MTTTSGKRASALSFVSASQSPRTAAWHPNAHLPSPHWRMAGVPLPYPICYNGAMSTQPVPYVTPEEYLEAERVAAFKSEYVSGQVWAMSGASRAHNTIASNLIIVIGTATRGTDCQVFGSDMRVLVQGNNTYAYPDITVVCGEQRYSDTLADTLTNPTVLIEILSPSTAQYDRTVKFIKYRRLPSLREYVLVHQDARRIEHFVRYDDIWVDGEAQGEAAALELASVGITLPLADIYDRVPFAPAD